VWFRKLHRLALARELLILSQLNAFSRLQESLRQLFINSKSAVAALITNHILRH